MRAIKSYLCFIYQVTRDELLSVIGIMLGMDALMLLFNRNSIENLIDGNIGSVFLIHLLFIGVWGFILAFKDFSGAVSLRGERLSFLISSGIAIVLGAIGLCILLALNAVIVNLIGSIMWKQSLGDVMRVLGQPFKMGMIEISFIYLLVAALGFFVGAVLYRIRIVTAVSIGVLPIAVLFAIYKVNPEAAELIVITILQFLENYVFNGWYNLLWAGVFFVLTSLLLKKAPIRPYAHDLI
jgi:hypothetical protein